MTGFNYWEECLAESFDEHGVTATAEQLKAIARDIEHARDGYSMCYPAPVNPMIRELKEAQQELAKERSKVACRPCNGTGRLQYNSGPWGVDTQCDKCRGEGKHLP